MKSRPWTELQAKFNRAAVESIDDTIYVESGRLVLIQSSRPTNQYLTEVMIDMPVLGLVDICQSRTLNIFDSRRVQLGGQSNKRCINAAETILIGELSKTHHHKLFSVFDPDGMSIAIVSLNSSE